MNDYLSGMLANVRVESFTCRRIQLGDSCGVRMGGSDWVRYCTVFAGEAYVETPLTGQSWRLHTGDTVMFPHGAAHVISGGPDSSITVSAGDELEEGGYNPTPTIQRLGNEPLAADFVLGGYRLDPVRARQLLRFLPTTMLLRCEDMSPGWKEAQLLGIRRSILQNFNVGTAGVLRHMASARFAQLVSQFVSLQPDIALLASGSAAKSGVGAAAFAMHEAPHEKWTVESLARLAAMSRSSFSAAFTETVGRPPMKYLANIRMARAAELLSAHKVPLSAAAAEAGYSTTIAFMRSFKRHFGVTPGEFRRQPPQDQAA